VHSSLTLPCGLCVVQVRVAVEVDGPSHFLGDSEVPTGATRLKRRQLRHYGWPVLPVAYFDFVPSDVHVDVYRSLNLLEALQQVTPLDYT
jgi:hypothetical protein